MAASQIIYAETTFLEGCIDGKRRTELDCYEALGLCSETIHKDPSFVKNEARQLHKRIKEIATAFEASHRNGRKPLEEILVEDGIFANECRRFGEIYRAALWSEAAQRETDLPVPQWNNKADRDNILYLIRCWITWHVVQKAKTAVIEISDDSSDDEIPHTPPREEATASSILPFRAPTVPSMVRSKNDSGSGHASTVVASAGRGRPDRHVTIPRSPVTPTKRKAPGTQGQTSSGKLQKVNKDIHTSGGKRKAREEDVYAGPPSPTPVRLATLRRPSHGSGANDTDSLYAPPREATIESETVFDPDEIIRDRGDLQAAAQTPTHLVPHPRSPSAGPSGTYRNPHRHNSVGLSTQDTSYPLITDIIVTLDPDPLPPTPTQTQQLYISHLAAHHLRTLRNELFTLLLSFLHHINAFHPTSYHPDAEQRLDHLLIQFWLHDADRLNERFGARFTRVQDSWHRWLAMRQAVSTFQQTTGYFGNMGEEWKGYLRGMDRVGHARGSIAFVELRNAVNGSGSVEGEGEEGSKEEFDEGMMEVFDVLTDVEGCTGVEEFEAARAFNEGLRGWFE